VHGFQRHHLLLSLHDTLHRFNPIVAPNLISVQFIHVIDDESASAASTDNNNYQRSTLNDMIVTGNAASTCTIRSMPWHSTRSPNCWCDAHAISVRFLFRNILRFWIICIKFYICSYSTFQQALVDRPLVLTLIRVESSTPIGDDTRRLHIYQNEEGLCYRRRNASNANVRSFLV
jgi:hypothetical protein